MIAAVLMSLLALQAALPSDPGNAAGEATLGFAPASPYRGLSAGEFTRRFYPAEAVEQEVSGSAEVECEVGPDLRPLNCTVVAETPPGFRFGAQTLRMIPQFVVGTVGGRPARQGDRFRFTFRFGVAAPIRIDEP